MLETFYSLNAIIWTMPEPECYLCSQARGDLCIHVVLGGCDTMSYNASEKHGLILQGSSVCFPKMMLRTYKSTWHHNPGHWQLDHHENLKSHCSYCSNNRNVDVLLAVNMYMVVFWQEMPRKWRQHAPPKLNIALLTRWTPMEKYFNSSTEQCMPS